MGISIHSLSRLVPVQVLRVVNVATSTTLDTATITWSQPQQNLEPHIDLSYVITVGGGGLLGTVTDKNFTASDLTPGTYYSFQVSSRLESDEFYASLKPAYVEAPAWTSKSVRFKCFDPY